MTSIPQVMTIARPTSAPSMTQMIDFVIIFFVIVLAGCAAIADSIFVCEDSANVIVKILVVLEVLLRDVFTIFVSQDKAGKLQLISVVERILCAEVVFDAVEGEVFFVCVHIIFSQRFRFESLRHRTCLRFRF